MEKEFSQWVYFDENNGKIIGAVYKIGTYTGIWGGRVYLDNNMENQTTEAYHVGNDNKVITPEEEELNEIFVRQMKYKAGIIK